MTGALMMVAACSYTGYALSQRFVQRHRQLTVLQMGLEILSSEIAYMRTPLPQAFKKIALRLEEPVSGIFFAAGRKAGGGGAYPREAWRETLEEKQQETALSPQDISVLGQLGWSWREMQTATDKYGRLSCWPKKWSVWSWRPKQKRIRMCGSGVTWACWEDWVLLSCFFKEEVAS
jgi:stage III sporulation protein AB